jgi:hypothetical protein
MGEEQRKREKERTIALSESPNLSLLVQGQDRKYRQRT